MFLFFTFVTILSPVTTWRCVSGFHSIFKSLPNVKTWSSSERWGHPEVRGKGEVRSVKTWSSTDISRIGDSRRSLKDFVLHILFRFLVSEDPIKSLSQSNAHIRWFLFISLPFNVFQFPLIRGDFTKYFEKLLNLSRLLKNVLNHTAVNV